MTNDNGLDVFDVVRKYVTSTQYVVLPRTNVKDELKEKNYSQEQVDAALTVLQLNGLLTIGFSDAGVYCLALTEKGIRKGELRDAAKAEEERLARLAQEAEVAAQKRTPPTRPEAEEEEKDEKTAVRPPMTKREKLYLALLCGGSAFLGAMIAGIITMIVVIAKVG